MRRDLELKTATLCTLPCDSGDNTHGLYTSCGFVGDKEKAMKTEEWYVLENFPSDIE
jgi:hypothetical protein